MGTPFPGVQIFRGIAITRGRLFLLYELVQLVLFYCIKSYTLRTEVVDGSNESLEHADQEYDPILWKGITLQNSFEKVDVIRSIYRTCKKLILHASLWSVDPCSSGLALQTLHKFLDLKSQGGPH